MEQEEENGANWDSAEEVDGTLQRRERVFQAKQLSNLSVIDEYFVVFN